MPKISGSCLCGSVRYACDAEPLTTAVCHCTHCQRQTGTAFSIIVGVPAGSLRFEGEDHLGTYLDRGLSGKEVRRRFCRSCGSPVVSEVEVMPAVHFLKAGTLDDRSWLKPTSHFWCDSAQPWVEISGDVERFPGNPAA
jgi:hypothetical protein